MPRASVKSESSPATQVPSLKKSTSGSQSGQNQKSILGFFQKKEIGSSQETANGTPKLNGSGAPSNATEKKTLVQRIPKGPTQSLTPLPSSDALDDEQEDQNEVEVLNHRPKMNGLPSPITPAANASSGNSTSFDDGLPFSSPSRKVCPPYLCLHL